LFNNNTSVNDQNISADNLYFTGYTIDDHGNIRLPYVGSLNVLGYTVDEVREKVKSELKKYIDFDKNIFVTVKLSGIQYTILGDISLPGRNIIYQNKVNIIEAIANAGDIIATGDRTKVEVLRNEFDGLKKYTVDITQVNMFDSEVFNILPHDIIYINPIKTKSWGIGTTGLQTFTTLASIFSIIATTILLIQSF
jgi:polysaccharide export outer membrane protein